METYIQLYNRNFNAIKSLMLLSFVLFLIGFIGAYCHFLIEKNLLFGLSIYTNLFLIIQGISMFFILIAALRSKRYFISWNKSHINFLFPGNKFVENIKIADIQYINVENNKIELSLNNSEIIRINLNFLFIPKRNIVKEYFENLRTEPTPESNKNAN